MSDLHCEFWLNPLLINERISIPEADVYVIAGDIAEWHISKGAENLGFRRVIEPILSLGKPLITIAGNHEYYSMENIDDIDADILHFSKNYSNWHHLQGSSVTIGNCTFVGATLWSMLAGKSTTDQKIRSKRIWKKLNDRKNIKINNHSFQYKDVIDLRLKHTQKLISECKNKPQDTFLILVSHHAPAMRCIPQCHAGDKVSLAYANRLDCELKDNNIDVDMFLFGHIHAGYSTAPFYSNPYGYRDAGEDDCVSVFNDNLVIQIGL